jgi:prepilin-type N-terminal cleavage/methylation domain-containing protein
MVKRQRGLSLIEMMVTLTVMLLLAAGAAPFSSGWANQAAVNQSNALLRQGMGQLKALALRNPGAVAGGVASAVLISVPGKLCLQAQAPTTLDCTGATWSATPSATIRIAGAASQCIAMDSAGIVLAGGLACSASLSYSIARGQESFDGTL